MDLVDFNYNDLNYKPLTSKLEIFDSSVPKTLGYDGRQFQIDCYEKFKNKNRTILIAPTGSGKSIMQIFNAAREIIDSDYQQKQIFVVPQLNIGNGFTEYKHKKISIDGQVYDWNIECNCVNDSISSSVDGIINFLLKKHPCKSQRKNKVLGGCTAVVSYVSLLKAFNKMSNEGVNLLKAFKNTSFRLDEIHHVSGVYEDGIPNGLGNFVKFVLDVDSSDVGLHLTTATFFRGDKDVMISEDYLSKFTFFRVPFLDHWTTLKLQGLNYNHCCYSDSDDIHNQLISAISKEPNENFLIYVPSKGQKFFGNTDKPKWINNLVNEIGKIIDPSKILDLVSDDRKKKDAKRLTSDNQDFSVVITCGMCKEGSDWTACSRIHNTILDNNVLQAIQKLGRGLRQHNDKTNVKMINYVPHFSDWDDETEKIRERLSERFIGVMAQSMLDDMYYPLMMTKVYDDEEGEISESNEEFLTLEDVYGSTKNELIKDMMIRIWSIPSDSMNGETIDEIIDEIIEEYSDNMLENVSNEELKNRLRMEIVRRQNPNNPDLRLTGMKTDWIREGWDKVVREYIANHSPFIGSSNTKDLEELQKFLTSSDWNANFEKIKKIGIKNIEKGSYLWHFLMKQKKEVKHAKTMANR